MSVQRNNIEELKSKLTLGNGAQFWVYISPQNNTSQNVTKWSVKFEQKDGNWTGVINSDNPQEVLQTPNLSGIFNVTVMASGPGFNEKKLNWKIESKPDIGCNQNCASMVGIVSNENGKDAHYWTVWDAFCDY